MKSFNKISLSLAFVFLFSLLIAARAGTKNPPTPSGSISGMVYFEGKAPRMPVVSMSKEPFCERHHKLFKHKHQFVQHEEFAVVNPNQTLRNVVIFIRAGAPKKSIHYPPPIALDQANCWFRPHVLAVAAGQPIKAINDDPDVLHNFHFVTQMNPPLNFSEPGEEEGGRFPQRIIVFKHPEMIPLICDIHPWMRATIAVLPNPFFSTTRGDGHFQINDLPPGKYTIEAWHEVYGRQRKHIILGKNQKLKLDFVYTQKTFRHPSLTPVQP